MFETDNPGCRAVLREVEAFEPYAALRGGDVDVVFNWLAVDQPDLSTGPPIDLSERVLLVAPGHPLAGSQSVCQEDLADWDVVMCPPEYPRGYCDVLIPPRTPWGRPTRRVHPVNTIQEIVTLVSLGRVVHPAAASVLLYQRDDIVQIPFRDMPPVAIGPIWCTAHENARIRALVQATLRMRAGSPA